MTPPRQYRRKLYKSVTSLRRFINQQESGLTAAAIMTSWESVNCINAPKDSPEIRDQASALMREHHYSVVPLVSGGKVIGVYKRYAPGKPVNYRGICSSFFLDDTVSMLAMLRHMRDEDRIAVIIGQPDAPQGWVTYADFSQRPFRVLLFAIVAEAEHLLACAFDEAYPNDSWVNSLEASYRDAILKRKEEAAHWDAVMPVTTFADLGNLVHAVEDSQKVQELIGPLDTNRLRMLSDLRNRVVHVVKPVIPGPKRIKNVADDVDQLLAWIDEWEARLMG